MKWILILMLVFITACSDTTKDPTKPEPTKPESKEYIYKVDCSEKGRSMILYATHYHSPILSSIANGVPMRDMKNKPLGPKLKKKEWCKIALEGSGVVDGKVYNYAGTTSQYQVDCSPYMDHKPSHKVKFKRSKAKYGYGVWDSKNKTEFHLFPYVSIAVDRHYIAYDSKVFIPDAKGVKFMFEGKEYTHNGCFHATDTGGLIKKNHIDVFLGLFKGDPINPFKFIKSVESGTFKAIIN